MPLPAQLPVIVGPNAGLGDIGLQGLVSQAYGQLWLFSALDKIRLFTNNITPNKNGGVAQFTEVTVGQFPDYVPTVVPAEGNLGHDIDGNWELNAASIVTFAVTTTAPPVPIIIYGCYVADAAGAVLRGWYKFPTGISLASIGDQVPLLPSCKVSE